MKHDVQCPKCQSNTGFYGSGVSVCNSGHSGELPMTAFYPELDKKKTFSIDAELLGLVAFICRASGPQVGQSGSVFLLMEIHEQLKPEDVEGWIISLAIECLTYGRQLQFIRHVVGKYLLSADEERYFRDRGFIYGAVPKIADGVIKYCQERYKILELDEE